MATTGGEDANGSTVDSFLAAAATTRADALPAGYVLDHFRIVEVVGRGGMGVVHRAVDVNLDRPVALKVMSSDSAESSEARGRFLREAKLAAALSHANLLVVYEVGTAPEGLFISMELVEGENLRARLRRGAIPIRDALAIARGVAAGLAHAHARGVVHRDLKPENVLVDARGAPKIADFGIAKALHGSSDGGSTRQGTVMGTVGYMSPEQAEGLPVSDRSDVWSFGVLLYELTTGALPFRWSTPRELLLLVEDAQTPNARALRGDVPRSVAALIGDCLSTRPAARPSMAEVVARLEAREPRRAVLLLPLAAAAIAIALWTATRKTPAPVAEAPVAEAPVISAPPPSVAPAPLPPATPATPAAAPSPPKTAPVSMAIKPKPVEAVSQTAPASASPPPPEPDAGPRRKKPGGVVEKAPF